MTLFLFSLPLPLSCARARVCMCVCFSVCVCVCVCPPFYCLKLDWKLTESHAGQMQELQDLVKQLLVHNPLQRLGMQKGGAADVKAHPWFAKFDWDAFAAKRMKAPYVPRVSKAFDGCVA